MTEEATMPTTQTPGRARQEVGLLVQEELQIAGVTESSFVALKEEAQALALADINSDADAQAIQKVITKGVRLCTTISAAIEPGKKWAHQLHKAYTSNENEFLGTVKAIIEPLKQKKEAWVSRKEQAEREELEKQGAVIKGRFAALEGFGFTRRTGVGREDYFSNGSTEIEIMAVSSANDEVWTNMLKGIETAYREEQDRKEAAERAEEEAREGIRRQQEEHEAKARALKEKEDALNARINEARKNELLALGCEIWVSDVVGGDPETLIGEEERIGVANSNGTIRFALYADALHEHADAQWADELLAAKAAVEERNLWLEKKRIAGEREQLIASRVKALKEAGWEQGGTGAGAIAAMNPATFGLFSVDSNAVTRTISQPLDALTEDDMAVMIALGNAELARRQAAKEEAEAKRVLEQGRYNRMMNAGYGSECGDAEGDGCSFTMSFDGRPWSIRHDDCYALSDEDFDKLLNNAGVEANRRKEAELQAAREKAVKDEQERIMRGVKEAREAEEDRQRRMNDVQRWEEWCVTVEKNAPRMASEIGRHAISRVIEGMKKMTPGIIKDLND